MIKLGINIIPVMPVDEIIKTAQAAEDIGYDYCVLADEGFMPDVYIVLGAIARNTSRIIIGPVTNGYTRHPAVMAVAMATLNELSSGRALATLVAGGSLVLNPMNIQRKSPLVVIRESVEVLRRLWTGEKVTYEGKWFELNSAQITMGKQDIPIWLAVRGSRMLELAGECADGVMLMVKADLGTALEIVEKGSARSSRRVQRVYIDRIAYTKEMLEEARTFFPHVMVDTPIRQLKGFMTDDEITQLKEAVESGGAAAVARLIKPDMIKSFTIAGNPEECSNIVKKLVQDHQLDVFIFNIVSGGFENNVRMMKDVHSIVSSAG